MRLLDERAEIASVADRWKKGYLRSDGSWGTLHKGSSQSVYEALAALPETASAADVARVIGNDSWIGEDCTECGAPAVVLVGDEPDIESVTAYLCASCVQKLVDLVKTR